MEELVHSVVCTRFGVFILECVYPLLCIFMECISFCSGHFWLLVSVEHRVKEADEPYLMIWAVL